MLYPVEFLQMKAKYYNAELIDYFTPDDYSKIGNELLSMGCSMVTLKSGHRGFYIKTNKTEDRIAQITPSVNVSPPDAYHWLCNEYPEL